MSLVDIEITKVKSPALFYAKVVKDSRESSEDLAFQQLEKSINDFFNTESLYLPSYIPNEGEICIGRRVSDRKWCRVQVKGVLSRRCGPEGRCFFLDYGTTDYIPLKWFRRASEDYLRVPYQVKKFCLYGVKALTLAVETEDLTVKSVVTDTWDTAAVTLMDQILSESPSTKARIRHVDNDNIHHIDLYVFSKKRTLFLNEEFVTQKYAVKFDPDESQADSGEADIQKLIKHTETLDRSLGARSRKHISGSCSDTEVGRLPEARQFLNTTVPVAGRLNHRGIHHSVADQITLSISNKSPQKEDDVNEISPNQKSPIKSTEQRRKPVSLAELKERKRLCETAACSDSEMVYISLPLHQKSKANIHIPMSPVCSPTSKTSSVRQELSPLSSSSSQTSPVVAKSAMLGKLLNALSPEKKEPTAVAKLFGPTPAVDSKPARNNLLHGELGLPLTRARLPKAAMRLSTSESDVDTPRITSRQISTSLGKNSSSASSEEDKLVGDLKKSILKKSPSSSQQNEKPSVRFRDSEAIAETQAKKTQMLGRLTGKRLLDTLCIGAGAHSQDKKQLMESPNLNNDGVLVHSEDALKPAYNIHDTPLDPIIREGLDNLGIVAPKFIQCYAWPALLRGRNVVGIAPSGSGKTLAYLAPLLTDLLKPSNYKDIPTGNGPYAIIIVPFWKSAQMVYDVTQTLLRDKNSFRVLVVYGGGNEESQVVPLINGCELLITTPRSLSRLLQQKYTHLERLCHVVIDDADIVLEEFREEIQDFMTTYSCVVEEHVERSAPREVLLFSSCWCNMVNSFTDAFMPDPTLIITSRFEAAVYGRVKHIPLLWKTEQLMPQFLELVSSLAQDHSKIIIFCSNVNKTLLIHKMLKSRSLYSLLTHDKMDTLELEQIGGEWAGPSTNGRILICTDESVEELKLVDARAIIHFDLPSSKTKFGNRLSTMSKYYYNSSNKEKVADIEPTSYVLITEESVQQVETILQLLKRTKSKIPRNLHSMVMGINEQKNCDGDKELCSALKAYGSCRYQNKCTARHAIVPEVDCTPQKVFNSGEVKMLVTNVVDASHYFVRILEHRPPTGDKVDLSTTMLELNLNMATWFGDLHNRSKYSNLCLGEMCAVSEDDETYHRVKVCDITGVNSPGDRIKAEILFVDAGRKSFVSLNKLYNLPPHLRDIPFQAMEVFICRVQPVDLDENWTSKASMFVYNLLDQKTLDGRIVLRIGNTLWLDPLAERIYLSDLHAYSTNLFVRSELLKNGFAVDNPNHLQLLYDLCKGQIEIPPLNQQSNRSEMKAEVEILPQSKESHQVHLSCISSPSLIYLQRSESCKLLEKMNDEINERMKNFEPTGMKLTSLKTGSVCLAKFEVDSMWYRVRILKELEDNMVEVFHVDFGDQESVSRDNLQKIPQEFLELPFQAIEASLSHVVPRGETWEKEAEDLIWDLAHYVTNEMKVLTAKVVTKQQAMYAGIHKYYVELYDTSNNCDVNLALELVWSGYATPTEDSTYHDLFSPPQDKQFFTIPILKLLDLCSQIYWGKGDSKAVTAGKEVQKMVRSCAKSKPLNLIAYGGLKAIIKLIGRVGFEDIHKSLMDSLTMAASKHDRICEEIVEQEGCVGLVNSLEQTNRPWLQEQVLIAMGKFLDISIRFLPCFEEEGVVRTLCELLDSSHEFKVQAATCQTMRKMCRLSEAALLMAFDHKVCSRLISCFGDGEEDVDQGVAMAAMELLDTLVEKNENNEDSLVKPKLVKCVVGYLKHTENETGLLCGLRYCDYYGNLNRRNKTTLLQLELVPTLDRLLDLPCLSSDIRDMCLEQKSSLVINVQSSQTIKNTPICQAKAPNDHVHRILPKVLWSETIFTVRLSIKVVGVDPKSNPVEISENAVVFRALVDDKLYELEYILYDSILPARSQVKVSSGEVTIVLRKNQKGRWPRLMKLKTKPPNLMYDFDLYEDSSSAEDEDCDEGATGSTRKSKKIRLPTGISVEKKREIMERHRLEQSFSSQSSDENHTVVKDGDHDPYDIFDVGH